MTVVHAFTAVVAGALLAGCASPQPDGYGFAQGWRKAKVEKVIAGGDLKNPDRWRCTRGMPAVVLGQRTYVIVSYRTVPHGRWRRLVALPERSELAPGDRVYVNLSVCDDAIVQRAAASARLQPPAPTP